MSRINDPSNSGSGTDQLRDKAAEVTQNLRDIGGQVRDAASEKYSQLRDQASEYYNQSKEAATQWEQSLESYVQEKPLQAVLIAAGVGLLLGLLWKRS
jgi:ElaB/YqjD/DUF883 family membrane-anchored ribosome-binding protein